MMKVQPDSGKRLLLITISLEFALVIDIVAAVVVVFVTVASKQ